MLELSILGLINHWMDCSSMYINSVEEARKVSQDMEDILENGGFRFKEMVMAGDPLEKGGELRMCWG